MKRKLFRSVLKAYNLGEISEREFLSLVYGLELVKAPKVYKTNCISTELFDVLTKQGSTIIITGEE